MSGVNTDAFYKESSAKSRYDKLASDRKIYVDRAIKNAKLTIPMLFLMRMLHRQQNTKHLISR